MTNFPDFVDEVIQELCFGKKPVRPEEPKPTASREAPHPSPEQVRGYHEPVRNREQEIIFPFNFEPGEKESLEERRWLTREITNLYWRMPLPSDSASYDGTAHLFTGIKSAIAKNFHLSDRISALLTFWLFSTWFQEYLSTAPCLLITGSAHDGDAMLRILKALCYHPTLLTGLSNAHLSSVFVYTNLTLLISEPNLNPRSAALLGASTMRGHWLPVKGSLRDYFGSKAVYVGEDLPRCPIPQNSLHVVAAFPVGVELDRTLRLTEEAMQGFQNQLLTYRHDNLLNVYQSDYSATGLSAEANSVATALGSCIIDAPEIQTEIVGLLKPQVERQNAERLETLEALAVTAALSLCHEGKEEMLVGEIAAEINRAQQERGETLRFSAEKVGHRLKKVGLLGRRLGKMGNGLLMDRATRLLLHELAASFAAEDYAGNEENLDCALCAQPKPVE